MSEKMNATEIKLNEVEKYFNEKISYIKDTVHVIDKKSSVIENELHHINDKISEMNSKFDSIPDVIKETITNTLNEKAVNNKTKLHIKLQSSCYNRGDSRSTNPYSYACCCKNFGFITLK